MSSRDLTEGPVSRAVLAVSAPMTLGILGVISVGLADAYFLGQVGQAQLAAVGFIYPVTMAVTSLSIGLSAGANAALSQALGRGADEGDAVRLGVHALGLGAALGVLIGALLWLGHAPLFRLLGTQDQVLTEVSAYMLWWCASFPFLVLSMLIGSIFRARGDGMTASVIMVSQASVNIVLDPILIFGLGPVPEMSTGGAALATFTVRIAATIGGLAWAYRQGHITGCDAPLNRLPQNLWQLATVGLPAAFSNAVNPAGMAMVTAAVATLGEAAVAGFGAATRVQTLALVPLLALSSGIGPVVGQNWGAERQDRARGAVRATFVMCLGYGAVIGAVLVAFGGPIAGLIASSAQDAAFATTYLRIVGLSLFGYGIVVTANAAMNARSKAVWSMGLSLARIFVMYLPLAWLLVGPLGFAGVAAAAAAANVAAALAGLWAVTHTGLSPLGVSRQS